MKFEYDGELAYEPLRVFPTEWEMRDGSRIAIKEMSTEHIRNTLNMIKGKGNLFLDYIKVFEYELSNRV